MSLDITYAVKKFIHIVYNGTTLTLCAYFLEESFLSELEEAVEPAARLVFDIRIGK